MADIQHKSNLESHAETELKRIHCDPETIEDILKVIRAFDEAGHSGSSAAWSIHVIQDLLNFKNLSPLTDDPDEWNQVSPDIGFPQTTWQSRRNSEAFSQDGGKTFRLNSEYKNGVPGDAYHSLPKEAK